MSRPAIVVAAFTVICCPRIARTAISNPSNAPGTRRPGFAATSGARTRSFREVARDHVGPRLEIEQRARRAGAGRAARASGSGPAPARAPRRPSRASTRSSRRARRAAPCARTRRPSPTRRRRAGARAGTRARPASRRARGTTRRSVSVLEAVRGAVRAGAAAQPRRRHAVAAAEGVVEAAQAREAARERHLGHGQRRLGEQLLREQQPARQHELDRRDAQLLVDDAAELARAQLEALGERFRGPRVASSRPVVEVLDDRVRDALGVVDRRLAGRQLGPAAQAGAEARLLGLLRRCRRSGSSRAGASAPGRSGRQ